MPPVGGMLIVFLQKEKQSVSNSFCLFARHIIADKFSFTFWLPVENLLPDL